MSIREKYKIADQEYYDIIKDILETDIVQQMDKYIQHGTTTTLEHSISVSYSSFRLAKKLGLDYVSVAKAALLHDFYLYDWHTTKVGNKLFELHGYTHPKKAYENANRYFKLNEKEKDIIIKHMWPLTLRKIPKYKESFVVTFVDKYISTIEIVKPYIFIHRKAV